MCAVTSVPGQEVRRGTLAEQLESQWVLVWVVEGGGRSRRVMWEHWQGLNVGCRSGSGAVVDRCDSWWTACICTIGLWRVAVLQTDQMPY